MYGTDIILFDILIGICFDRWKKNKNKKYENYKRQ